MTDGMSIADALALRNDDGGFGGESFIWVVILFILFGFGGFGGNNRQNDAVSQEILSNQHFDALNARITSIGNGICDSTYALNNSILTEGRALQTQLADCCCNTQLGIANLGANIDRQTCAITTAVHAEGEATRAMMRENEIQNLRDKVADLQLRSSQCDQNAYLISQLRAPAPVPSYQVPNPYGCGCGCGCNGMNI